MIHLDASFVIDLLRETARRRPGPALDWIEAADGRETLAVSVHVLANSVPAPSWRGGRLRNTNGSTSCAARC